MKIFIPSHCLTLGFWFASSALAFFLVGCTDPSGGKGAVRGTVTLGDQPVTGGTLLLKQDQAVHRVPITVKGTFAQTNVPAGTYQVAFETDSVKAIVRSVKANPPEGELDPETKEELETMKQYKYMPLPEKYKKFETSGFSWTITTGDNEKNFTLQKE